MVFEKIKKGWFSEKKRPSQKDRILALLRENKDKEEWLSVVEIMRLSPKIANHTARITELKQKGYQIWNKTRWVSEGPNMVKYSVYKLISEPNERK